MKTQVIRLEPHDDLVSVRDKMSWAKTERILLDIPRGTALRARSLDLRLLLRHAEAVGARLAIVTRAEDMRTVARELGIPVFSRLVTARRRAWPAGPTQHREYHRDEEPPDLARLRGEAFPAEAAWRGFDWVRILSFSLAVLAILAVLLLFIPSATIRLIPATRLQSLDFTAVSGPEVEAIDLQGRLPARLVSLVVERTRTISASGSMPLPDAYATGIVQFRNLTTSTVDIPAGTVVTTQSDPPQRFTTIAAQVVAAGFGKTAEVPVQAVQPGAVGNLQAGKLVAMEAGLGTSLTVTNPQPTTGGTDRTTDIPTEADRASLHNSLLAEILAECRTNLDGSLQPGDIYFPGSLAVSQTLVEAYFPAAGQAGDSLSLTLRLQCQARYASAEDLNSLAGMLLNVELPDGYVPAPGGLLIESTAAPVTGTDEVTRWQVHVDALVEARVDPQAAVQLSLGRRPATAAQRLLQSLPLAGLPLVEVSPSWWPWLPLIPFNIAVTPGG